MTFLKMPNKIAASIVTGPRLAFADVDVIPVFFGDLVMTSPPIQPTI